MTPIFVKFSHLDTLEERGRELITTNPLIHYNITRSLNVALIPTVETILNCVLIYAGIMRGFAKIIEISRLKYIKLVSLLNYLRDAARIKNRIFLASFFSSSLLFSPILWDLN